MKPIEDDEISRSWETRTGSRSFAEPEGGVGGDAVRHQEPERSGDVEEDPPAMHGLLLPQGHGPGRRRRARQLLLLDLSHHEPLQDEDEDGHEAADEPPLEAAER